MRNVLLGFVCLPMLASGAFAADTDPEKVLNLYEWADYFSPTTLKDFQAETGIEVKYDNFGSDEEMEAKLLAGHSGYDLAGPSSMFFPREVRAGLYQKLGEGSLKNWGNIDPDILKRLRDSGADPKNEYAMPYIFGITGFVYNVDKVHQLAPDAPVNSTRMLFDPAVTSKLKGCGVNFVDSPEDIVQLALIHNGKAPTTQAPDDIKAALDMAQKVRPDVRTIDSDNYLTALAAGDICVSVAWSGNDLIAATKAKSAGKPQNLAFVIPTEGAPMYIDNLLILADAPHPKNARLFLDYLLRPAVAASIVNSVYAPLVNVPGRAAISPDIAANPTVYPDAATMQRVKVQVERDAPASKMLTREWVRFKTGQ